MTDKPEGKPLEDEIPKIVYEQHIKDYMSKYMHAQEELCDLYAYIGHAYSLQIFAQYHGIRKKSLPKMNVLITGETGSGKSFGPRKFAEAMGMYYQKIDCSTTSAEGWHGTQMSTLIHKFLENSPLGFGVLHLDEVDKIACMGAEEFTGKGERQTSLLELLDGDYQHQTVWPLSAISLENINNCLIILSGSFQKHRDAEQTINRPIGFMNNPDFKSKSDLTWKDKMIKLGFSKEFAARIVHTIELEKYTASQIKDIILNTEESAYNKYKNLFGRDKSLTDVEIDDIVKQAENSKNGLRELDTLFFQKFYARRRGR